MQEITKDNTVGEIITQLPESVNLIESAGVKCFSCDFNQDETLKSAMDKYNLDEPKQNLLLFQLNKLRETSVKVTEYLPEEKDFKTEEIVEGNKSYYQVAGLLFTQNAYRHLHQLKTASALRINLQTGGCSGFKNRYEFTETPSEDEKTYTLSNDLRIFMNDFTFNRLYGSIADFEIGLYGSGLKIVNPNVRKSCHCGVSFGF